MDAGPMITRCFRHQHPECYDRPEVTEPALPWGLQWGPDALTSNSNYVLPQD